MTKGNQQYDRGATAIDNQRLVTDGGQPAPPTDEMNVTGRPADRLHEEFETESELIEFLKDGSKVSEFSGIGSTTSNRVFDWFETEYSEANRERIENDEAYCTEYYDQDERNADGEYLWGFICPRCESENPLKGNPEDFRNRPFGCTTCNWVSCLHADAVERFIESVDRDMATKEVATDGGQPVDYEYRAIGAAGGGWRRSEWVDKEQGLSDYERASEEWGAVAFERRVSGDDSTIQRKRKPSIEEWMDVTEDDLHFVDEEVKS